MKRLQVAPLSRFMQPKLAAITYSIHSVVQIKLFQKRTEQMEDYLAKAQFPAKTNCIAPQLNNPGQLGAIL